jgi:hypothetical protein
MTSFSGIIFGDKMYYGIGVEPLDDDLKNLPIDIVAVSLVAETPQPM